MEFEIQINHKIRESLMRDSRQYIEATRQYHRSIKGTESEDDSFEAEESFDEEPETL